MSADNYYVIKRHPLGGYAAVMGFMSDDFEPHADELDPQFDTPDNALSYAMGEYSEYGVSLDPKLLDTP